MYGRYDFPRRKSSRPKSGLVAKTKKGAFAEQWWAVRWMGFLESTSSSPTRAAAEALARGGRVITLDVEPGRFKATVQGDRDVPHALSVQFTKPTAAAWRKLATALRKRAIFGAKLLTGELPDEFDRVAREAGISLMPERSELRPTCDCGGIQLCAHSQAACFLLAERIDRDPFLLFTLVGSTVQELLERVCGKSEDDEESSPAEVAATAPETSPLPADEFAFWGQGRLIRELSLGQVRKPPVAAAVARGLGNFPFWRGKELFLDALTPVYDTASSIGLNAFLGEEDEEEDEE
jgi:uncharacterized Zn finger protein